MSRRLDQESKEVQEQHAKWLALPWYRKHWPSLAFIGFGAVIIVVLLKGWL